MFYSGIADEASRSIDRQIQAHQELGWNHIELRLVDGTNITQLSDDAFDMVRGKLEAAGMQCSCFGSAIANWARPITGDAQVDINDLKRSIPRMQALGTPFIRVMSYPNDPDRPIPESEWRAKAIQRMKVLAQIAEDGGVILAHENCSGWGGQSAANSLELLAEVNSPALKIVFDTGNPVTDGQDPWECYQAVRDHIVYVHIKDAKIEDNKPVYCYCGEGEACVGAILSDLIQTGYDGGVSIEPHLMAIIHTGQKASDEDLLYQSYTEYGRRLMAIIDHIQTTGATRRGARPMHREGISE